MPPHGPYPKSPLKLAVFISGGGTTLRNLLARIADRSLDAEVRCVVSSNPKAKGLQFAAEAGIPAHIVERKSCSSAEEFQQRIFEPCRTANVDLVAMGGFLKHVLIPADFAWRVINIHPSLLPRHGGKGMYGHFVHEAVLKSGDRESGCTIHFVDNEYDHGPAILQRRVPVEPGDSPDQLATRVFEAECEAYPAALKWYAAGQWDVAGGRLSGKTA